MSSEAVQDAISFLQKVDTTAKTSLYDQLTNLVIKVGVQHPAAGQQHSRAAITHARMPYRSWMRSPTARWTFWRRRC
jgi:hypothetical protein